MQKLSDCNSFGLVADGTTISVMEAIRFNFYSFNQTGSKCFSFVISLYFFAK